MKKLIVLLSIVLLSFAPANEISIKGFSLGQTTEKNELHTTVAGVQGVLYLVKLKNQRIYMMVFAPTDNYGNKTRVLNYEVENLTNAFEKKFGITMKKKVDSNSKYTLSATKEDYTFQISVQHHENSNKPYEVTARVFSISLKEKKLAEITSDI